jgi:hypothetical protein
MLAKILIAIALAPAALAQTYPSTPYDFANDPFADRPPRLYPAEGTGATPLLVVFIPLIEDPPYDYSAYDEAWFANRVFGVGGPFEAADTATYVSLASLGNFAWTPADETAGVVDNGVVIVAPQNPEDVGWRCHAGRDALELANDSVYYPDFDADSDGNVQSSELSVLVFVGGPGAGQSCGVDNPGSQLDGVTFHDLAVGYASGPNGAYAGNAPEMVHELFHARFDLLDWYGFGIGSMGIMGVGPNEPWGPSALLRLLLGWDDVQVIDQDGWYRLHRADRLGEALLLYDPDHGTDEYFLVENRVRDAGNVASIDQGVADSGLFITGVDTRYYPEPGGLEVPALIRVLTADGRSLNPACRYTANLDGSEPASSTVLEVSRSDFPSGSFMARISNAGELDELVNVTSIVGNALQIPAGTALSHGGGAEVMWRAADWTDYFATNLAVQGDENDTTIEVGAMLGTPPATPFPIRIFDNTDNPYSGRNPGNFTVTNVSGTSWTLKDKLDRDYALGARVVEEYKGGCAGVDGNSAWDTADGTGDSLIGLPWQDGTPSPINVLGIGPAAETTEVYVDLPGQDGLFNVPPEIIRPAFPSSLLVWVDWKTAFTGDGTHRVELRVQDADGYYWLNVGGNPTVAGPWTEWNMAVPGIPRGLEVHYDVTVPVAPSVNESGSVPVDYPFAPLPDLNPISSWSRVGTPRLPAGFGPGSPFVIEGRSPTMSFGAKDEVHSNEFGEPEQHLDLLPTGFPTFPRCGEVTAVPPFEGPSGAEMRVRAETVLEIQVEGLDDFTPSEDRLDLDRDLVAPPVRPDIDPANGHEIDCPTGADFHRLELGPRDGERSQRYRYQTVLRQTTHFFPEAVGGLGDTLRLNGTPARSVPCEGGFFPSCRANVFGEIELVLPAVLASIGPPGCPAGCPEHYVTFLSDIFSVLDLSFTAPPGTAIELLDRLGNTIASSFPAMVQAAPGPLRASADTTPREERGPTARPLELAAVSQPLVVSNIMEPILPPPGPGSPFIADDPPPPEREELRLIAQAPPDTYYLHVVLPQGFDASADPHPITVRYLSNDRDADGFEDASDNCPDDQNDQADGDQDGVGDVCDNCPQLPNSGQGDLDGDSLGDVCDSDRDGDGLDNDVETETWSYKSPQDTGTSPDLFDSDNDGFSDGVEVTLGSDPTDPNSQPSPPPIPTLSAWGTALLALLLAAAGARRFRRLHSHTLG